LLLDLNENILDKNQILDKLCPAGYKFYKVLSKEQTSDLLTKIQKLEEKIESS
jgi:hypothetical protein